MEACAAVAAAGGHRTGVSAGTPLAPEWAADITEKYKSPKKNLVDTNGNIGYYKDSL